MLTGVGAATLKSGHSLAAVQTIIKCIACPEWPTRYDEALPVVLQNILSAFVSLLRPPTQRFVGPVFLKIQILLKKQRIKHLLWGLHARGCTHVV